MKMSKERVIEDLRTIGDFFAEQSGAVPIAIEEAIRLLSAGKPQKNAKKAVAAVMCEVARFCVVDRATGVILTPFFEEKKTARLALNKLEGEAIMKDEFEPDSYEIRTIYIEEDN